MSDNVAAFWATVVGDRDTEQQVRNLVRGSTERIAAVEQICALAAGRGFEFTPLQFATFVKRKAEVSDGALTSLRTSLLRLPVADGDRKSVGRSSDCW